MKRPSQDAVYVRRGQLDEELGGLKKLLPVKPKKGWIREIRKALQMTTVQLAKRLGVSQSVISNFERSEREKTIRLNSLVYSCLSNPHHLHDKSFFHDFASFLFCKLPFLFCDIISRN